MSDTNQRKAWIDVLKGIAIFFVVLGHNPYLTHLPNKVFNVIFSFHIPLLFFISGYLFNPNTAGGYLCKKRFNSLIRPYIFTVGVISLTYILAKTSPSPFWYIFWAFYGNGPNLPKLVFHLWFLPNLFLVTLFTWLLFRYIGILKLSNGLQLLLIIIFMIFGSLGVHLFWNIKIPSYITNFFMADGNHFLLNGLLNNPAYLQEQIMGEKQFVLKGLPWSSDIVLVTAAFFISGYFVRKNALEIIFHKHSVALLMVAIFSALHFYYNYTIDMNLRRYDNILISTVLSCAGIHICTYAANIIAEKKSKFTSAMQYIGLYSLIIFIFHSIIQSKTYFTIAALLPDTTHAIAFLPALMAGIGIPLLLNWLILERFRIFRFWFYAK